MIFGRQRRKESQKIHTPLADVHCHLLPGLDDGAENLTETMELLQQAYEEGIRLIVFTPHVREPWMRVTEEEVEQIFLRVHEAAKVKFPDLSCYLGGEIYFLPTLYEEHRERFRTMHHTDYILVEFSTSSHYSDIRYAVQSMVNDGFYPILAHIERYECLWSDVERITRLKKMGAYLQVNANTIVHPIHKQQRKQLEGLLRRKVIDFIATDAHDTRVRCPRMQEAYHQIVGLCGEEYADLICYQHARQMMKGVLL